MNIALKTARPVLLLATVVAAAFLLLVLLPNSWFGAISSRVARYRNPGNTGEPLWLESLGEEKENEQLRVYGTVRNADQQEINQPQVMLKIYGMDGSLLSAVVAPMRAPTLAPQATCEFSVVYLHDTKQIYRFALSFQAADGTLLPHKDVRGAPR